MKIKRIIAVFTALMMMLSLEAFAYEDKSYDNIFDNPVLELVAPVKDESGTPSEDAMMIDSHIVNVAYNQDNTYSYEVLQRYSDGSYTTEYLFDIASYDVYPANRYYPAYIDGDASGKYVAYVESDDKSGDENYIDIYLLDTTGDEVTKTLIGSMLDDYNYETYESTYTLFSAREENGETVRTQMLDAPISEHEFEILKNGTLYNDGLKFDKPDDVEYALYSLMDINGKIYFEDPQISYFNYFYNLGYLVTTSNNGGVVDYSVDDYEKQVVFNSSIENVFTGELYSFNDVNIMDIYDSGYALVSVKDDERNETTYIARIKKPAVITVTVNGEKVLFDVLPTITDNRTLVPLRAIFEVLGASVEWDGNTQTITALKEETKVVLTVGSDKIIVNDEEKILDVPAQIVDGRTLVPARAIAEAFGCNVDWDAENKTVIIS